jgi:hypothetical protein
MRRIIYLILLFLLPFACTSIKDTGITKQQSVSVKSFLEQPFGVDETVKSLKNHFNKGVKLKKFIRRNKHDDQKVDTIFQFYYRKSEVFIYKTYFNREMLLGGVITDNKFPLINGVVPGMKRDAFFKAFNDLDATQSDSVKLNSKELMREFDFIFNSKGELKKINFSSYVD